MLSSWPPFSWGGVIHVLLHGVDFACCSTQLYYGALTIVWAITVRTRITDQRLRSLMLGIVACLLLYYVLQIGRYELFWPNVAAKRYLWYAYYIPTTALPLLLLFIAFFIYCPRDMSLPHWYVLLIVIAALLVLGVFTNDLHFAFASFPSGIMDSNGQEKMGPLHYAINVFSYGLYIYALIIIQGKRHRYVAKKYRWIATLPLLIGAIYFLLYPLDLDHMLFPTRIWQIGEMQAFCTIGTLEACIHTGMIPANRSYVLLFSAARFPAVIRDGAGRVIYQTAAAKFSFAKSETKRLVSHPIQGGRVEYLVDMEQVQRLNQELLEITQQIETRNDYIAEENRIKKERAELEARNRLYERVSGLVKPRLEQIDRCLGVPGGCGEKELARAAVLQAYIKRRSNMELLAASGELTVVELASAVEESLDYVRLCGVNAATSSVGTGSHPAAMVIAAYEQMEEITEESLDTLTDMVVTIRSDGERLVVRLMLRVESFSYETNGIWRSAEGYSHHASITKEGEDMIIVLTFQEGGGQK